MCYELHRNKGELENHSSSWVYLCLLEMLSLTLANRMNWNNSLSACTGTGFHKLANLISYFFWLPYWVLASVFIKTIDLKRWSVSWEKEPASSMSEVSAGFALDPCFLKAAAILPGEFPFPLYHSRKVLYLGLSLFLSWSLCFKEDSLVS